METNYYHKQDDPNRMMSDEYRDGCSGCLVAAIVCVLVAVLAGAILIFS